MSTDIYAFGSLCRGEIKYGSDIDLLVLADDQDGRFDSSKFSIYSYERISILWNEGNPFAWHLYLESKLVYSEDCVDYLKQLGTPAPYERCYQDCTKFKVLLDEAVASLKVSMVTSTFDLSTVFLSMRNIATCFSLGRLEEPVFARDSALRIGKRSINIDQRIFKILERARILCTRGYGASLTTDEIAIALNGMRSITGWASEIIGETETL